MEVNHTFRTAFSGFNREDVVHYIEYINTKHSNTVNQLKSENSALSEQIAELQSALEKAKAGDPEVSALKIRCQELEADKVTLAKKLDETSIKLRDAQTQIQNAVNRIAEKELEAYRRAEKAERAAQARAQSIFMQATGTLADATAEVDTAAEQFQDLSTRLTGQMTELQALVVSSRNALKDAAARMYALQPDQTKPQDNNE